MDFPFEGTSLVHNVRFNSFDGIGNCMYQKESEGRAFVSMRASVFLSLALSLPKPRESLKWLRQQVTDNACFAPSMLTIRSSEHDLPACVVKHEGRHRMLALMHEIGDFAFPVEIWFENTQGKDLNIVLEKACLHLRSQMSREVLKGPFFDSFEIEHDLIASEQLFRY